MNCTKVLHALGGHPQQAMMPVDFAMRLYLSQTPPLYQLLGVPPRLPSQPRANPTRTSLRSPHSSSSSSSSPEHSALRSCFRRNSGNLNRKRVVFADAKGLALTAVRLFVPEPPSSPATVNRTNPFNPSSPYQAKLQVPLANHSQVKIQSLLTSASQDKLHPSQAKLHLSQAKLQGLQTGPTQNKLQSPQTGPTQNKLQSPQTGPSQNKLQGLNWSSSSGDQCFRLRLGFPQPTVDLKRFSSRLQEGLVQLESCSVTKRSLAGTVRVCNISSEKAVHVRVTLDSWRSHRDVPCILLPQRYGASDTDVFVFDVALPQSLDPKERLEFCVLFRPGAGANLCWDDNRGQNYRVLVEAAGSNMSQGSVALHSSTRNLYGPPSWPWNPSSSPSSSLSPSLSPSSSTSSSSSSSTSSFNVKSHELTPDQLTVGELRPFLLS